MTNPQAGWYNDPSGNASYLRYWDGQKWTNDYTSAVQPEAPSSVMDGSIAAEQSYQQAYQPGYQQAPQPGYDQAHQPAYQQAYQPGYQQAPQLFYEQAPQPGYDQAHQPAYPQDFQQTPQPVYQQDLQQPYQRAIPLGTSYVPPPVEPNNGVAVASLILGSTALLLTFSTIVLGVIPAIIGIVLGAIGLGKPGGRGMAIGGIILSILSIAIAIVIIALIAVYWPEIQQWVQADGTGTARYY